MSTALDRTLANDVRTMLIGAGLSLPGIGGTVPASAFTIDYLPRFEAADISDLRIVIAPRSRSVAPLSRASRRREMVVQIATLQNAAPNSDLFLDLIDFVAAMDEYLAFANTVSGLNYSGIWQESQTILYDIAALEQHGAFRSVLTVTYSVTL